MKLLHALRKRFLRRRTRTVRFHGLQHQYEARMREKWAQKPWRKGLYVLIAILFIYVLFISKSFEIQKIEVNGDVSVEKEKQEIQTFFEKQLGKNLLLFPSLREQESIEKKYPSLKNIHINKKPFHTLSLEIISYNSVANLLLEDSEQKSYRYVLNEEGKINEENKHLEGLPIIFLKEVDGKPTMKNPGVMKPETLQKILKAKEAFENKFAMNTVQIDYKKRSREIHLHTEKGFVLWLDAEQDIEAQLHKLKLALSGLDIYSTPLEYIDLRITGQDGEKVIYK